MKQKRSFSNPKKKNVAPEEPETPNPPPPPGGPPYKTKPGPMLKDKTFVPRLKDKGTSIPTPKIPKPPRLPLSPGTPVSPRDASGPRFMSMAQAQGIEMSKYRPPPLKTSAPKMPTLPGITPLRLKRRTVEVKRESRPTRIMKALKNPDMMKIKWKGTVKDFLRIRMMKRLNGCMRAFHAEAQAQAQVQEEKKPLGIEYKPIYRLKEIKRASIMPKPKRPVSVTSVDSMSTVNRRRFSGASSIYSRRLSSTAEPSVGHPGDRSSCGSILDDYSSLRDSLLPYQDWWAYLHSTPDLFIEDDPNDEHVHYNCTTLATPIHRSSHRNSSFFPFPQRNSLKPHTKNNNKVDLDISDDSFPTPPSPTSSEVTITPTRFHDAQNMPEESKSSSQDMVEDLGARDKAEEASGSKNKETHIQNGDSKRNSQAQDDHASTMEGSQVETSQKQASPKDGSASEAKGKLNDDVGTRIPRGPIQKPYPGMAKGARATPDHRSAIPIAARRLSAGNVDATQNSPSEEFAGGIRVLDRPPGPRPRPATDLTGPSVPESIQETGKGESGDSSSSSSISSWDLDEGEDELQKPPTVFTGEYRTRLSERQSQNHYGPMLKIAGSAENVIMGTEDRFKSSIVTQRSSPLRVKYIDRTKPDSHQESDGTPKSQNGQAQSQNSIEQQPQIKNFCRPQVSPENIPKKDMSNRELSMARRPLKRPSLTSLFAGSAESLNAEDTPPVPKVSISKDGSVHKPSPLSETKKADALAPTPSSCQNEGSFLSSTPEPMRKNMTALRSHPPPRSSSLQAVADFPMNSDSDTDPKTPGEISMKDEQGKRDITFDDIAQSRASKETHPVEVPRLPDSKSNRMLDSFRNMFKHKGVAERGRAKKEESDQNSIIPKDQSTVSVKSVKNMDEKTESTKAAPNGKAKYSKLSDGVGWNKVSRNPKISGEFSPAFIRTPTSTLSASFPTPLNRNQPEERTPSFAQPTQSTRTKASSGSKLQTLSAGQEGRPRRIVQGAAASTGSPQRPTRSGIKCPGVGSTTQRPTISQPRVVSNNNQENIASGGPKQSEPVQQKSFKEIRSCIEKLCNKACDEGTPSKRERYLRLALSLQQQLSDFQSVEKEAGEAQFMFNSKKSDKDNAEESLFEYFSQVQVQLDED